MSNGVLGLGLQEWNFKRGPSSRMCVAQWPVSAAPPEVDEDDHACDRRIRTAHRGKRVSLDRDYNRELAREK